jgi:hypothetical protein
MATLTFIADRLLLALRPRVELLTGNPALLHTAAVVAHLFIFPSARSRLPALLCLWQLHNKSYSHLPSTLCTGLLLLLKFTFLTGCSALLWRASALFAGC